MPASFTRNSTFKRTALRQKTPTEGGTLNVSIQAEAAPVRRLRTLALIFVCAAALCLISLKRVQTQSTLRRITNTTEEGININPSISGDGKIVAFESTEDIAGAGGSDHFRAIRASVAVDPATFFQIGGTRAVTPAISQDGSRIAFASKDDPLGTNADGNSEIFLFDSAKLIQVTNTSTVPSLKMSYGRAISDDGTRVVYSAETATNSSQVFLYDGRTGNAIKQITSLGARTTEVPLHPTISGDGTRIAFATRRNVLGGNSDGSVELYVFDVPTAQFSKLTNAPSSATAEAVSSLNDDGSIVAFNFPRVLSGAVANSDTANNSEIYVTAVPARPAFGVLTAILNGASFGHEPSAIKAIV